jgi:PEP-CTERM motif
MRHSLYLAAAAALGPMLALASPAQAGLQSFLSVSPGVEPSLSCAPPGGSPCVYLNPTDTQLTFAPPPFSQNGVLINGELITATGVPGAPGIDNLSSASLAAINENNAVETVTVIVSDIDYAAPVNTVALTGSGTFQATVGSTVTYKWFADTSNTQGADTTGSTPGTLLNTFSTTATGIVQSFSTNFTTPFSATDPFSMTIEATYTLQPFGELLSRGTAMVATNSVPEPSTWVMMALGFAGLGFLGHRSSRTKIAMID